MLGFIVKSQTLQITIFQLLKLINISTFSIYLVDIE